jgi:hypothetical protein
MEEEECWENEGEDEENDEGDDEENDEEDDEEVVCNEVDGSLHCLGAKWEYYENDTYNYYAE